MRWWNRRDAARRAVPTLFENLERGDALALEHAFEPVPGTPGEVLIEQGTPTETLYLITEGEVEVLLLTGGRPQRLGAPRAGTWVGEMGMIMPGPASARVQRGKVCDVLALTNERFARLRRAHPAAAGALVWSIGSGLADRLRDFGRDAARRMISMADTLVPGRARPGTGTEQPAGREPALADTPIPGLDVRGGRPRVGPAETVVPDEKRTSVPHAPSKGFVDELRRLQIARDPYDRRDDVDPYDPHRYDDPEHLWDVSILSRFMDAVDRRSDEVVAEPTDSVSRVFLVLSGSVVATAEIGPPVGRIERRLRPGEWFGHMGWFLRRGVRPTFQVAYRAAPEGARVAVLQAKTMEEIVLGCGWGSPVGVHLMTLFARQLVLDAKRLNESLARLMRFSRGS